MTGYNTSPSLRGNSSVGRARPCQGRGREFESRFPLHFRDALQAGCQSGYVAACKAAYAGSIPAPASIHSIYRENAQVAKLVDARDLKSLGAKTPCRFDSGPGHHHHPNKLIPKFKYLISI